MPFDESFEEFVRALCLPEVAEQIGTLVFWGPDEGANGTKNWDFSRLLVSEVVFSNLKSLFVEPDSPEDHNHSIIARDYDEDGQIAGLLKKAPQLQSLTVPSAPDASFFEVGTHPLTYLRVETGYDTQNFILNFSQSSCLPLLRTLDFGDYNQRYFEEYPCGCTIFEHYKQLSRSKAFAGVGQFVLRSSILSAEQLAQLQRLRKDCQFMVIQTPPGNHVR